MRSSNRSAIVEPPLPGEDLASRLASSDGLTAQQSSFDRRDVVRAAAAAARGGASLEEIESFVDRFLVRSDVVTLAEAGELLRRQDVIRRHDGRLVSAIAASPRYSTAELLAVEQRVTNEVLASRTGRDRGAQAGAQPDQLPHALDRRHQDQPRGDRDSGPRVGGCAQPASRIELVGSRA